jgi:uncharacterized protein (DUF697 family)
MRIAILCHTELVEQLAALQLTMCSAVQSVLGCSPTKSLWVDIVDELVTVFWKQEE